MSLEHLLLSAVDDVEWNVEPRSSRARISVVAQSGAEEGLVSADVSSRQAPEVLAERLGAAVTQRGARVIWAGVGATARGETSIRRGGITATTQVTRRDNTPFVHLTQNLSTARAVSEEGVLVIGNQVRGVAQLARQNSQDLAALASQFNSGETKSVAHRIEALTKHVRTLRSTLVHRVERQATAVSQAARWTSDILRLGQAITDIAATARMLTFNARVESARIGEQGKGFAVIAHAIQDLALQIRAANDSVTNLVNKLATALPDLRTEADGLARSIAEDTERIEQHLGAVNEGVTEVHTQSTKAVEAQAGAAAELKERISAVLEAMQFQDRASQLITEAEDQAKALLVFSGLSEVKLDQREVEHVGHLGRAVQSEDVAEGGAVILM